MFITQIPLGKVNIVLSQNIYYMLNRKFERGIYKIEKQKAKTWFCKKITLLLTIFQVDWLYPHVGLQDSERWTFIYQINIEQYYISDF